MGWDLTLIWPLEAGDMHEVFTGIWDIQSG